MPTTVIRTMSAIGPLSENNARRTGDGKMHIHARYPIYREGTVVRGADSLTESDVRRVTESLIARERTIAERESQVVTSHGGSSFAVGEGHRVVVRHLDSPIVDFPNFTFDVEDMKLSGRSCITVCERERHSKIWLRIRLLSVRGVEGASLESQTAIRFFQIVEPLSEGFLSSLKDVYEKCLAVTDVRVELTVAHRIYVKGLDFDDEAAEKILSCIVFGRPLSEIVLDTKVRDLWEYFTKVVAIPQLSVSPVDTGETMRGRFGGLEPWIVETSVNQQGFYLADINNERSRFWGFSRASDEGVRVVDPLRKSNPENRGVADDVSIRLINKIGRQI
jgi:hypothetical protein